MKNIFIECKSLKKTFKSGETIVEALKCIDLTIYEKELVMIVGPSGSGKTTLLSIIGGIMNQDSGDCIIMGEDFNSLPQTIKPQFRGKNIGFVFQHFNLVPLLNIKENVAIPLLLTNVERETSFKQAINILTELQLQKKINRLPKELSGGEQQRVAIARSCIHKPKVILCDEPTSFLDLKAGKNVINILKKIQEENNCAIVIVTHDPRILEFADRILEIEDGKITEKKQ
jgi:putative ABC transport system ATP-binding protein